MNLMKDGNGSNCQWMKASNVVGSEFQQAIVLSLLRIVIQGYSHEACFKSL